MNVPENIGNCYQIEGIMDDEVGNNLYLNKDVSEYPFGSGGSIRYIS